MSLLLLPVQQMDLAMVIIQKQLLLPEELRKLHVWEQKMGAHMETFYGLSGMGDLIVTCASVHSRNRKAGYLMGKGYTMQQAMNEVKMVVEGVYSAKAAKSLAEKYDVECRLSWK